jgi:hypothetical protein
VREINIGFSKPNKWKPFSAIIRWLEKTDYSHVYVKVKTKWGTSLVYQASGHQVNFIGEKYFNEKITQVKEYKIWMEEPDYDESMKFCTTYCGAGYSVKQAIGVGLARIFKWKKNPFANGSDMFICSEFALRFLGSILRKNDIIVNFELMSPKDVDLLIGDLIKKGIFYEYIS